MRTARTEWGARARRRARTGVALWVVALAPIPLAAQNPSPDMNFFLAPTGPTFGANQPAQLVADSYCATLAYPQGFGHLTWRAYLTEGAQAARTIAQQTMADVRQAMGVGSLALPHRLS